MATQNPPICLNDGVIPDTVKKIDVPKTKIPYSNTLNKHKRAGSTGTTGDESYTTDSEDEEKEESSYEHVNIVCNGMFTYHDDENDLKKKGKNPLELSETTMDHHLKDKISWETLSSSESSSDSTKDFTEIGVDKNELINRLQEELRLAQNELKLRDEEIVRLTRIRTDVEAEIEDLTASLFQVCIMNNYYNEI